MITKNIIEGLTILEKYRNKPDGYNTGAEHDQIYAYRTDNPVSDEDVKRLFTLGWFQPETESEDYDEETGWSCYV